MKALASYIALLPVVLLVAGFAENYAGSIAPKCLRPAMSMTKGWPTTASPRLPIALRLPAAFVRDTIGSAQYEDSLRQMGKRIPSASLWRVEWDAQLSIRVLDAPAPAWPLFGPEDMDSLPEASTCRERIGDAQAVVQSYNKLQWVGEGRYGPYVVGAQLRFPDGVIISAFGFAETPARQAQMLAAIRTIRLRAP